MTWSVVKFIKENCVECVPTVWYIQTSSECFWPPNKCKRKIILKYIQTKVEPQNDWSVHPATLLGTFDDYNIAQKKTRKAIDTSDISSTNENLLLKRKKKKNRKFMSPDSEATSSEDDFPPIKKGMFGPYTPAIKANKKDKSLMRTRSSSLSSVSSPEKSDFKRVAKTIHRRYSDEIFGLRPEPEPHTSIISASSCEQSVPIITTPGMSKRPTKSAGEILSETLDLELSSGPSLMLETSSCVQGASSTLQGMPNNMPAAEALSGEVLMSHRQGTQRLPSKIQTPAQALGDPDFKKLVTEELVSLHLKVDALSDNVNTALQLLRQREVNIKNASIDEIHSLHNRLPVKSKQDLIEFEEWLQDKDHYNLALSEFQRFGGQSMAQAVRTILYRTLSNDAAMSYSWDGAKGKSPFKTLELAKCLLDAIKLQYPIVKEMEIINVIKIWLVKAKERTKKAEMTVAPDMNQ